MADLHLHHDPARDLEGPGGLEGLVERLGRRRYRHEYADAAAGLAAARRHVERTAGRGRLLEVRDGAEATGEVWWVADGDERAVVDVVLSDLALAAPVRGLLTDLARAEGAVRLTVTVSAGDPVAAALVDGGGFELAASQMLLELDAGPPAGSVVVLDPMDPPAFAAWEAFQVEKYAAEREAAGESPGRARRVSREQHAALLPDGLGTAHHHFFRACLDGVPVGTVWIGTERPMAFVYDLEIDASYRRRGHGAATMRAAARWAHGRGATALGLNVFGPNHGARALYDRLGYTVTEDFLGVVL